METLVEEKRNEIVLACEYLLSVCDGAVSRDGQGFNKGDSLFVRSVLYQPFPPTRKQLIALHKVLRKYKRQLMNFGIDYDSISVPENGDKPVKPHESAFDFEIRFGKYRGKSLGWVAENDPDYLRWIAENFNGERVRECAKATLEGKPLPKEDENVYLSLVDEKITIKAPYKYRDVCRNFSERKWNPDKKVWEVPFRLHLEVLTAFPDAQISDELKKRVKNHEELKKLSSSTSADIDIPGLKGELLPFQKAGVAFMEKAGGRVLVADEMGLGKTVQALAYLQLHPELRPALIICPASLKINWKREAERWLSEDEKVTIVNGEFESDSTIFIMNYDILRDTKDRSRKNPKLEKILEQEPKVLILDESHYIKNHKSQRTKTCIEISKKIPHRILLTGTPVLNRPKELWTQLHAINPETFDNFFNYAMKYCDPERTRWGWNFNGASNLEELNEEIRPYMIRRRKADVLSELPEKHRITVELPITNPKEYLKAHRDTFEYIKETKGLKAALKASKVEQLTRIETLKQVAVRGKLNAVFEWIDNFFESSDDKLVVFAHHQFVIEAIYERYKEIAVKLTGETSMKDRQKAVDEFQNNPETRLFVGNIQAAGVGLTLTAASTAAFVELAWTPSAHTQAEDRIHRIGQRNTATIYYLVAAGTIEERIAKIIRKKAEITSVVTDGESEKFDILEEVMRNGLVC